MDNRFNESFSYGYAMTTVFCKKTKQTWLMYVIFFLLSH